jgi:hypothetical protein
MFLLVTFSQRALVDEPEVLPCRYHSSMVLHAHISPGGWTVGPLVAAVRRHSLTPLTLTPLFCTKSRWHFKNTGITQCQKLRKHNLLIWEENKCKYNNLHHVLKITTCCLAAEEPFSIQPPTKDKIMCAHSSFCSSLCRPLVGTTVLHFCVENEA